MAQADHNGGGTTVLTIIAVALVAFVSGYFVGNRAAPPAEAGSEMAKADVQAEGAVGAAAVGTSAVKGNPDAMITIVEFSDFQCPFCSRGGKTALDLVKKYPNDVKVVFKHNPLPFHKQAPDASKAAMAAGEQGKFWEMHDLLFEKQKEMKTADMAALTAGLAQQLGLDVAKFKKDYANPKYDQVIKDDMAMGSKIGVRGTPHFFINGVRLSGAQPINKFEEIINAQLEAAKKELAAGTARADLYKKMVEKNYKAAPAPSQKPSAQATVVHMVPVRADDPMKGEKKNFKVTIVEFSDFQCPFCTRVNPTLDQVMKNFGKDVRIVFKQNALAFHKEAEPAARASLAAHEQGKFWEMHDLLFARQKEFRNGDIDGLMKKLAAELGLNAAKFEAAYNSDKAKNIVKEDMALAGKVGARGTPNFFINGVQVVGAKPYPAFESEIKKQLEIANKLAKEKGLSGEALYKATVEHNKANAPKAPAAPPQPSPKVDLKDLNIGNSPVKGPKNAPITIFEFSDFQCPYCSRANSTVQQVIKDYPGKIKLVFKSYPLPFHKEAEPAHITDQYARELGLNMDKFTKDFNDPALAKQVKDEMAEGSKVGVRGTPAFFINGNRLVGAQPIDRFKAIIDAELKK
jgi:protein-disulfide isomerase